MNVYVLLYTNVETGDVELLGVYSTSYNADLAADAHYRNLINECDFDAIVDIVDEFAYTYTSAGSIDLESDSEVSAAFFDLSYQIICKTVDNGV